jgi:hypothetical protein
MDQKNPLSDNYLPSSSEDLNLTAMLSNCDGSSHNDCSDTGLQDKELEQILQNIFNLDLLTDEDASTHTQPAKTEVPETQTQQPKADPKSLDYTVRGACGYFSNIFTEKSWSYTYGNSVDKMTTQIVDDNGGVVIDQPFNKSNIYNTKIFKYVDSKKNGDYVHLLQEHHGDNLLLSCIYKDKRADKEQVFHSFVPLDDPQIWKKGKKTNDTLVYASLLSDLHYKIYLKNYTYLHDKYQALQKADDFMQKAFPGAIYQTASYSKYTNIWGGHEIDEPNSLQASYYRKLNNLAWEYTDKRVDLLNDVIADNYETYYLQNQSCTERWVCETIFPNVNEKLLKDPEFHEGVVHWKKTRELYGNATGSIQTTLVSANPRKYNVKLSLFASHGTDMPISYLDIHQDYDIQDSGELDDLILKIKSKSLFGGTTSPWNLTSSGIAAYYACFNDASDESLGCMIVTDYTDRLTIDIYVGMLFDLHSTPDLYIIKGSRKPFMSSYNLGKVVDEHLPSVRNKLSQVRSVQVGAFVGEATQTKRCTKCKSSLEAEKISLEKAIR